MLKSMVVEKKKYYKRNNVSSELHLSIIVGSSKIRFLEFWFVSQQIRILKSKKLRVLEKLVNWHIM